MRRRGGFGLVLAALGALSLAGCASPSAAGFLHPSSSAYSCDVYFSPKGGCTELIVRTIGQAKQSILVQAYSFTSQPIADALVKADQRGVNVNVLLDQGRRNEANSQANVLRHAGIPVLIDAAHAIAHNKVMVIDREVVITGSFNFTKGAEERNAENLLMLRDPVVAAKYEANWQTHRQHCQPY